MPVFDTAAAARASRLPHYLDIQQKRALTAGTKAQTDLMNKQVEMYDTEVGIEQQKADTAASKTELDWNKYFGELGEQQTAWFRDSLAAGFSAQESGEDPTEAMINSLDINMPGGRDEVLAAYPDIKWDEEKKAWLSPE
jgi:hypothetical protein